MSGEEWTLSAHSEFSLASNSASQIFYRLANFPLFRFSSPLVSFFHDNEMNKKVLYFSTETNEENEA